MSAEVGAWPVEPTTFFVFNYYPTNGVNEEPTYNSNLMQDYNTALQAAKDYITAQANVGVCVIMPVSATVVYPFQAWEAF